MNIETVTISKREYEELEKDCLLLNALRSVGVDNWDGYDIALEQYNEWRKENNE